VNGAERSLGELLSALDVPEFDTERVERACRDLAQNLAELSRATPLVELERVAVLHAALRELVDRRRTEVGRALAAVVNARARGSRLTRPDDVRSAVEFDA
jgi:hypothetical protein